MSNQAHRFQRNSNRKSRKVQGTSEHMPKAKFEAERQERSGRKIETKTANQKKYLKLLEEKTLIACSGPAGVGKTLIPCYYAANLILGRKIDKIVLTRPYASCGRTMGFNSGNLTEKIYPFMLPMLGYLKDVLGASTVEIMLADGRIEIVPFEVIRGRSFSRSLIICDECQSTEVGEVQALTTRIGEDTKLVMCGDTRQNDVKRGENGLSYIERIIASHPVRDSAVIKFDIHDIVRHGICRDLVEAFEKEGWA